MRIACLRVADLPLAAALRADPELRGRPLAIASGAGPRAELLSVSPEAASHGVRRGASAAQARSLCAGLVVRASAPAPEAAARGALLDAAFACAPRAEAAPPAGGAYVAEACAFADAGGTAALFHSEAGFAAALAARARSLGLPADVAVASSRCVARIAARQLAREPAAGGAAGRVRALSPDSERDFLRPLSLDLFDPDDAVAEALTRFGVRSAGELLALPRRGLARRLGPGVLALLDAAARRAAEAPLPEPRETRLAEAIDLEAPVAELAALLFALRGLLARLLERLTARHLGCGGFEVALELEGGARATRRVGAAAPTADLRVLTRLAQRAFESQPPGAPVLALRVEARAVALHPGQPDLFRPAGPAPAALGETVAALESLCGEARVGAPAPADAHHPDAYRLLRFAPSGARDGEDAPAPGACALRALRPPLHAQVQCRGESPVHLRSAVAGGRVLHCAGPWRSSGGWWSPEERFAFESFDVQTEDGVVVRLRHDLLRRAWQVDGVYD